MSEMNRRVLLTSLALSSATVLLGGCVYKTEKVVSAPVAAPPTDKVVSYPGGRYQLYGDANTGYYWVWIPAGTNPPPPPPPPRLSQSR
jgi:hypothetical protein